MITHIKLRDFRCFAAVETEFVPGTNVIVGPNAQGKTSLLESACVLLRLQSPRSTQLATLVRIGAVGFVVDGFYAGYHLQFYYSSRRKKLALDSVEQRSSAAEYLQIGRVVWFSNGDIALVRGGADERRRYLDFIAGQIDPSYRKQLRSYERALRARNQLLKAPSPRWREIEAFDEPLIAAGNALSTARSRLVSTLQPFAQESHTGISGAAGEQIALTYLAGSGEDFAETLRANRAEDARLRQTTAGPHRDDVAITLNTLGVNLASEGQQRTAALALRLAQVKHFTQTAGKPPLLLLDDIFGELDPARRNALLEHLPEGAQKIITTTHLDWAQTGIDKVFYLENRTLTLRK